MFNFIITIINIVFIILFFIYSLKFFDKNLRVISVFRSNFFKMVNFNRFAIDNQSKKYAKKKSNLVVITHLENSNTWRYLSHFVSYLLMRFNHNTLLETIWTIIPIVIVLAIAIPSFILIYALDASLDSALVIKAIGHQWYWSYDCEFCWDLDLFLDLYYFENSRSLLYLKMIDALTTPNIRFKLFPPIYTPDIKANSDYFVNYLAQYIYTLDMYMTYVLELLEDRLYSPDFSEYEDKTYFKYLYNKDGQNMLNFKNFSLIPMEEVRDDFIQFFKDSGGIEVLKDLSTNFLKDDYNTLYDIFRTYFISAFSTYKEFGHIQFDSYMKYENQLIKGEVRLLEVDNALLIPYRLPVDMVVTSMDVIHSWAVPSLGVKLDATPGRLTHTGLFIERQGVFFGQCSELCGVNHAFMPIKVVAVSYDDYLIYCYDLSFSKDNFFFFREKLDAIDMLKKEHLQFTTVDSIPYSVLEIYTGTDYDIAVTFVENLLSWHIFLELNHVPEWENYVTENPDILFNGGWIHPVLQFFNKFIDNMEQVSVGHVWRHMGFLENAEDYLYINFPYPSHVRYYIPLLINGVEEQRIFNVLDNNNILFPFEYNDQGKLSLKSTNDIDFLLEHLDTSKYFYPKLDVFKNKNGQFFEVWEKQPWFFKEEFYFADYDSKFKKS
jgi:heme/copper-type cytochrome/quinol oxidase subunit 2